MGAGALPPPATVRGTACRRQAKGPSAGGKARHLHTQPAAATSPHTPQHTPRLLWGGPRRGLRAGSPHPRSGRPHTSSPLGRALSGGRKALMRTRRCRREGGTGKETAQNTEGVGAEEERGAPGPGLQGRGAAGLAPPRQLYPGSLSHRSEVRLQLPPPSLRPQKARDMTAAPGMEGPVIASQWPAAGRKDWPLLHSDASLPPAGGASPCPSRLCGRRSP